MYEICDTKVMIAIMQTTFPVDGSINTLEIFLDHFPTFTNLSIMKRINVNVMLKTSNESKLRIATNSGSLSSHFTDGSGEATVFTVKYNTSAIALKIHP